MLYEFTFFDAAKNQLEKINRQSYCLSITGISKRFNHNFISLRTSHSKTPHSYPPILSKQIENQLKMVT